MNVHIEPQTEWVYTEIFWGDVLTPTEIMDIEASWEEIEQGKAKVFRRVDKFLEELKQ